MTHKLDTLGAWLLGILWFLPLAYTLWAAFHPSSYSSTSHLTAPQRLYSLIAACKAASFERYFLNAFILVTMVLAAQLVLSTLAAYAFARFEFKGRDLVF